VKSIVNTSYTGTNTVISYFSATPFNVKFESYPNN
jgi:hypothetical protein